MLLTEAIGIESQLNEFPKLESFKMAGEELFEYLPYIYHRKMDSENEQSYHHVKTRRFVLDNKHKCQIKINHSSTHVSFVASAILFRKLCRLFQISSGRDGRASKSERRPIERTGIVLPIPAPLPLAQTGYRCWLIAEKLILEQGLSFPDHWRGHQTSPTVVSLKGRLPEIMQSTSTLSCDIIQIRSLLRHGFIKKPKSKFNRNRK